jgi:hypothetical protein
MPLDQSSANNLFNIASYAVVFGSLLALCGTAASIYVGKIRDRISNERVAQDEAQTAVARANAERSRADASAANERALQAQLDLEKFRAARTILDDQLALIADSVRKFSGTQFDSAFGSSNHEQAVLVGLIETALLNAGWKQLPWAGNPNSFVTNRPGRPQSGQATMRDVLIRVSRRDESLYPAAGALASALQSQGITAAARVSDDGGPMNYNEHTVHLLVGAKM